MKNQITKAIGINTEATEPNIIMLESDLKKLADLKNEHIVFNISKIEPNPKCISDLLFMPHKKN